MQRNTPNKFPLYGDFKAGSGSKYEKDSSIDNQPALTHVIKDTDAPLNRKSLVVQASGTSAYPQSNIWDWSIEGARSGAVDATTGADLYLIGFNNNASSGSEVIAFQRNGAVSIPKYLQVKQLETQGSLTRGGLVHTSNANANITVAGLLAGYYAYITPTGNRTLTLPTTAALITELNLRGVPISSGLQLPPITLTNIAAATYKLILAAADGDTTVPAAAAAEADAARGAVFIGEFTSATTIAFTRVSEFVTR